MQIMILYNWSVQQQTSNEGLQILCLVLSGFLASWSWRQPCSEKK